MFFLIFLGLDFQITNYFVPDTFLKGKKNLTWGLFLMDTYIVSNYLLGHRQLLCLFAWVPATACGTLPV